MRKCGGHGGRGKTTPPVLPPVVQSSPEAFFFLLILRLFENTFNPADDGYKEERKDCVNNINMGTIIETRLRVNGRYIDKYPSGFSYS